MTQISQPRLTERLQLTVKDIGAMVEFSVADDGPGIAPEYHERIFGVFQTLVSRDTIESTGIGLSIVKKLGRKPGRRDYPGVRTG